MWLLPIIEVIKMKKFLNDVKNINIKKIKTIVFEKVKKDDGLWITFY